MAGDLAGVRTELRHCGVGDHVRTGALPGRGKELVPAQVHHRAVEQQTHLLDEVTQQLPGRRFAEVQMGRMPGAVGRHELQIGTELQDVVQVGGAVHSRIDRNPGPTTKITELAHLGPGEVLLRRDLGVAAALDAKPRAFGEMQVQGVQLQRRHLEVNWPIHSGEKYFRPMSSSTPRSPTAGLVTLGRRSQPTVHRRRRSRHLGCPGWSWGRPWLRASVRIRPCPRPGSG